MSGTNCLGNVSVDVTVTFNPTNGDTTYNFFNNNFNAIIGGLATAAGVSVSAIQVKSVLYQSVILTLSVTSGVQGIANSLQNSINSYFDNLNLPGLKVAEKSVVNPNGNNNGNNDNGGGGNNTTLIIAIVIPIIVVRNFSFI